MVASRRQSGFTLIEMIVSLGVFSVVVTIAVGALLVLVAANRQLQDEQGTLSNLAFALDSMTREIRTGTSYVCHSSNATVTSGDDRIFNDSEDLDTVLDTDDVADCHDGRPSGDRYQGVAFLEGGDSITGSSDDRILYYYDNVDHMLYRRVGSGAATSIVSDGIYIVDAEFFVTGSAPIIGGTTDNHQAAVTIFIEAAPSDDSSVRSHPVQTTVVQRTLDI